MEKNNNKSHNINKGACKNGVSCNFSNCKFSHPPGRIDPDKTDKIEKGACKNGVSCNFSNCKFSHPPGRIEPDKTDKIEKGACKNGVSCNFSNCKFSHPLGKLESIKTEELEKGVCRNGISCNFSNCKFSHPFGRLESIKTKELEKGVCKNGVSCNFLNCKFSHPLGRLEAIKKEELEKGVCKNGVSCNFSDCKFSHPLGRLEPIKTEELEKGVCRNGILCNISYCKFSHPPGRIEPVKTDKIEKGACKNGISCNFSNCKFSHPPGRIEPDKKGVCKNGVSCNFSNCKFSHPLGRLESNKTEELEKGVCKNGVSCNFSNCKYSHPLGRLESIKTEELEKEVCRKGISCNFSNCKYSHPLGRQESNKTEELEKGVCRNGISCNFSNCKFSHPPKKIETIITEGLEKGVCRNGILCNISYCKFSHPPGRIEPVKTEKIEKGACKNGISCNFSNCKFSHPLGRQESIKNDKTNLQDEISEKRIFKSKEKNKFKKEGHNQNQKEEQKTPLTNKKKTDESSKQCAFGKNCMKYECELIHPLERSSNFCPEKSDCQFFDCEKIHPFSRKQKCKSGTNCLSSKCTKLHPNSEPCPQGENCFDCGCKNLHFGKRKLVCNEGISCENFECNFFHPNERISLCLHGRNCKIFECEFLHPFSRKKCKEECSFYGCKKIHPSSRKQNCKKLEECIEYNCQQLHPSERKRICNLGFNCLREKCEFLHPLLADPCVNGSECADFYCNLSHPKERIKTCRLECKNSSCACLHPNEWNPPEINVEYINEKGLRTQNERDEYRKFQKLQILSYKEILLKKLKADKVIVVTGGSGSGKTTQIPQYTAEEFPGLTVSTQPRTLTTITIAQRIANEFDNFSIGGNVGYKIWRGKPIKGKRIQIISDEAMVQKAQKDQTLKDIQVLIIDEAHERRLNTDLIIGMAKKVRELRPDDFYVVIISASEESKEFLELFFGKNCPHKSINIARPVFHIKDLEMFDKFAENNDRLVKLIVDVLKEHEEGNCLVFLAGKKQIDEAVKKFNKKNKENWVCFPFYDSLNPEEQSKVLSFDESNNNGIRMIVFSTDLSLSMPNIRIVIDTGLTTESRYDIKRRITLSEEIFISKFNAIQRRNQAGENAPGIYVKLYNSKKCVKQYIEPEILRCSLDSVVLKLKVLGIDPVVFPFITQPNNEYLKNSIDLLEEFGCLDTSPNKKITDKGKLFTKLPFETRMNNFIMMGHEIYGEGGNCAIIASILRASNMLFYLGTGNIKQKVKGKLMETAFNYDSDIEMLWDVYNKWFTSGKCSNSVCDSCKKTISKNDLNHFEGCKTCRFKFAQKKQLNSRIIENVCSSQKNIVKILNKLPNKGKISFNIPFTEIIGRCLIASFKEQIGEIILPENPSVGVHLLNNGEKALFSLTSVFLQKQQRKVTTLISMSIFQQPSGYLILDHVHPINPNWIPDKLLTIIKQNQKEIQECIVYKNVNSCYMSHLLKEIRALEKTTNWARFTVVTYDNPNSALKVYGPKISFDNIRSFCKNEIEKQKKADLNFETKILLSNTNSIATFTSGLNFLKIEPASKSKFRFIVNPEIKTKDDFIKWLCEKALINENDIKYCTFFKKPDKDKAFAIVGFSDEEVIKNVKSATNVSKELSKSEDRSNTIRWKILNPNIKKDYIENFLKTLQHPPIKIYQKKPVFFNILINDLPDKFCNVPDLKNFIGNYYFSRLVSEIFISKYKDQKLFAYLKFKTSEERKLAFQEIEKSSFRSDLMVINGGSIRSQIREEQSDRKKICYNLTFSNSEAVSTFCKISQNIASSYEGFADLRIERPYLFPLEEYSKSISEKYNVKFKIPQIKNNQEFCFITLTGPTPKQVGQAANQFMKTLTSMNVRLSTRQSQTLIKDINDVDLLDQWDKQFGVEHKLSEDKKTGSYYKLEIFGNQISQGAFMAEILNYSNDFNQRYHTVALPNNMNFLFKKDRIGSNYLKKLNQEINKKGVISYVHKENIIEIYVKPKQSKLIPELTQKITEFFKTHSYLDKNEIEEQTNTSCVFCAKEEGQSFAICGHNFCPSCLKDQANTSSNSGKLVECSKCQTPVSIRDLRLSFSEEELASLAQTIVQYRCIHEAKFPIAFCPIESCLSLREKSFGYSICASCGTPSCPLCGEQNKPLHLEKTCEQLRKEEKEASEFDLTSIFDKAKNFVNKKWDFVHLGKVLRIDINPGLALGCPSIQKFYKALQKIGLTKIEKSFFGWHGTSTQQALVEICHNGFDPNRRSGQAYGPGEYFGQTSVVSHSYARSSSRMIVTLILNVPESSSHGNFCYVVNNPKNSDLAYNLPVLVVTYEKDNGIINFIQEKPASLFYKLSCSNQKTDEEDNRRWIPAFRWAWKMDDGSYKYYSDYINALIENYYTLFINNQASCTFLTPPIVRFVDDIPQEYFIDFDINTNKYTQKNKKTNYIRKITRIKIDLVQNNVKWQFQNENGQWQNFESLVKDCIEDAFRLYFDKNGSPNFRGLKFPGRPETYTIDFVQGIQINENTKVERIIRRIE